MPYRINPTDPGSVQVKKSGKWQNKKTYTGKDRKSKAHKYLAALKIHTGH